MFEITLRAMAKNGHWAHEHYLGESLDYLTKQGYRVIRLHGKAPDGIAISKDGKKIFALDIITHSKDGKDRENRARNKISDYMGLGFDNVYALIFDKYNDYETMWYATNGKQDKIIDNLPKQTQLWVENFAEKRAKFEAELIEFRRQNEERRETTPPQTP
jgi:hypothetical protein